MAEINPSLSISVQAQFQVEAKFSDTAREVTLKYTKSDGEVVEKTYDVVGRQDLSPDSLKEIVGKILENVRSEGDIAKTASYNTKDHSMSVEYETGETKTYSFTPQTIDRQEGRPTPSTPLEVTLQKTDRQSPGSEQVKEGRGGEPESAVATDDQSDMHQSELKASQAMSEAMEGMTSEEKQIYLTREVARLASDDLTTPPDEEMQEAIRMASSGQVTDDEAIEDADPSGEDYSNALKKLWS